MLTRGGSGLARQAGISPMVIGITIVSVGTSTPELAVGVEAALEGAGSLAVGNIAGTNIVNILLILGLTAALRPLLVEDSTIRVTLPAIVVAATLLTLLSWKGHLSRFDGTILLAGAVIYTVMLVRLAHRERAAVRAEYEEEFGQGRGPLPRAALRVNLTLLVVGIVALVLGSTWLVNGAVDLATQLGVSNGLIGLTVVAIGTSSPELATTIVGTIRNERDIAIGNLFGSSVYNILLILGLTGLAPGGGIAFEQSLIHIDLPLMTAVAFLLIPILLTGRRISRIEGVLMVAGYLVYFTYLLSFRT